MARARTLIITVGSFFPLPTAVTTRLASSATIKESEYILILEVEPGPIGIPGAVATITCRVSGFVLPGFDSIPFSTSPLPSFAIAQIIGPRDLLAERLRRASCGAEAAGIMSVASTGKLRRETPVKVVSDWCSNHSFSTTEFYTSPLPIEKPPEEVVNAMSRLTLADVCGLHEALMDPQEASISASEMIAKIVNASAADHQRTKRYAFPSNTSWLRGFLTELLFQSKWSESTQRGIAAATVE